MSAQCQISKAEHIHILGLLDRHRFVTLSMVARYYGFYWRTAKITRKRCHSGCGGQTYKIYNM